MCVFVCVRVCACKRAREFCIKLLCKSACLCLCVCAREEEGGRGGGGGGGE